MNYTISISTLPESVPVRGNALASGDEQADKACEDSIIKRLEAGDIWAWCNVCVTVRDSAGHEESECLGCCSYVDEADFVAVGYFTDMVTACLERLASEYFHE